MAKKDIVKKIEDKEEVSLSSVADVKKCEVIMDDLNEEDKPKQEVARIRDSVLKKVEHKEFFAIDDIESHIVSANKASNYHLASELHKINVLLCDLNHTFLHISGEAKLITSISLKNGKILKC